VSSRRVSTNTHNYQATNRKREEIGEVYILSFFAASAFKNVLKKFFSRNPKPKPKSSPNFVAKKNSPLRFELLHDFQKLVVRLFPIFQAIFQVSQITQSVLFSRGVVHLRPAVRSYPRTRGRVIR
tara:strand:+ start:4745 stop:5119 length:375 start_codon:yes stop_codon:yes gene_type:complete